MMGSHRVVRITHDWADGLSGEQLALELARGSDSASMSASHRAMNSTTRGSASSST